MIIGITGTDGAGKGTVVDFLVSHYGFVHCSARALWVEEIKKRGFEVKRENMRLVANSLRAEHGNDFLVTEYKRKTGFAAEKNYIIDSIRTVSEVETLQKEGGVLWAVDAEPRIRFERIRLRASESDKVSLDEFVAQEELEMNDPNPNGMQKAKVMSMANHVFQNNATPEELFQQVEEVLTKDGV